MKQIADGLYCVRGLRMGRVYVIKSADGLTLVDTSFSGSIATIERELRSMGCQLTDVKRILITHAHLDHVGGLSDLQRVTGARVYAHPLEAPVIRGEQPVARPRPDQLQGIAHFAAKAFGDYRPAPARVEYEVQGGVTLDEVLPGLQVIDTPGHSPGHVSYWLPDKRLLFCGDVVRRLIGELRLPYAVFTLDMAENRRSLRKIADMDIDVLCPGHGEPFSHASATLREFAERIGA